MLLLCWTNGIINWIKIWFFCTFVGKEYKGSNFLPIGGKYKRYAFWCLKYTFPLFNIFLLLLLSNMQKYKETQNNFHVLVERLVFRWERERERGWTIILWKKFIGASKYYVQIKSVYVLACFLVRIYSTNGSSVVTLHLYIISSTSVMKCWKK